MKKIAISEFKILEKYILDICLMDVIVRSTKYITTGENYLNIMVDYTDVDDNNSYIFIEHELYIEFKRNYKLDKLGF